MTKKYLFLLFLFCSLGSNQQALSARKYIFRTLSPEGGFYYDGVKDIIQDKEGFVWILMDENLYRFDGYEYESYYSGFVAFDRSIRWTLNSLAIDSLGHLFVSTNNGLFQYERKDNAFKRIYDHRISQVKVDSSDNLWIYTDYTWHILNRQTQETFTPCDERDSIFRSYPFFCIYENDSYVLATSLEVFRYNNIKREFDFCFQLPKRNYIHDMYIHKGKLWLLSDEEGFLKIDLATSTVEKRLKAPTDSAKKCFFIDKYGLVWLGTMQGLYIINPETQEYTCYTHFDADRFCLPNNSIWSIKKDNHGDVWVGTFSGGLAYADLEDNMPFNSHFPEKNGLNHAPVSGFAEDDKYLWISTEGGGLNRMDKRTGEYTYYRHHPHANSISSDNIKSLALDKYNRLWISTFNGGMDCLDIETQRFKNYSVLRQDSSKSILSNSLRKITLEADSGLWVVYQHNKQILSYYSFKNERFTHFRFGPEDDQYYIFDVLRGRNNRLWILTYEKLYEMDLTDYSIHDVPLKNSFYLYGRSLSQDASGHIWIGTTGNGLIRYNPASNEHVIFTGIRNWGVNTIYSILPDDGACLWLGTDNGLIRFDLETHQFRQFEQKDGGQGRGYYPLSNMKSIDGQLYFGGTKGFTAVQTDEINKSAFHPRVIISDFLIDNVSTHICPDEEVVLNYDQTNFGIKFASDSYLIPEKTRYKYKLHGYDDRWFVADASNRIAYYSKVPAGDYVFEIIAANNDDVWSATSTLVKIQREPAPWLSWWAYLIYILLFLSIAAFIYYHYSKQKKLKLQLYLDELEKNKREELHQSQLRFFTNISHDFRTPLTLIVGVLAKLKHEGIKEYYYNILRNNAQRLLNLVNELMEFRTIENGKMNLHVEPADINRLVRNTALDFNELALQRKLSYRIQCDPSLPSSIMADRQIVEKIVMNLLNNAFKYTKEGDIAIETYCNEADFKSAYAESYLVDNDTGSGTCFLIVVRDTGIGISKESIKCVFERFYKVDTANANLHLGTGIGLALVRSLVLLHKGKIAIYSEKGKGSDLVVYLPFDASVYGENSYEMEALADRQQADDDLENVFFRNKKRILVVEDNHELRGLMLDFLSDHYEIVEAENGMEATELLSKMEIDLIVSDIMMPMKDGIEFCKEVKGNLETSHIPVVLLTAKTGTENKIEGADAGADFYFEKPIDFNLLLVSINNIFDHQTKLKEYYSKNYFVESPELTANEQDNKFLQRIIEILEGYINQPQLDVNYIASELSMSRSKLYLKIKALTGKSIIEFILNYKLKKAARIIIEEDVTMRQVMERIGIESQSYFTNAFKKEFGETPAAFAAKNKHKK